MSPKIKEGTTQLHFGALSNGLISFHGTRGWGRGSPDLDGEGAPDLDGEGSPDLDDSMTSSEGWKGVLAARLEAPLSSLHSS